jgi:hypothetical protein
MNLHLAPQTSEVSNATSKMLGMRNATKDRPYSAGGYEGMQCRMAIDCRKVELFVQCDCCFWGVSGH